jgi:hypothetical protein
MLAPACDAPPRLASRDFSHLTRIAKRRMPWRLVSRAKCPSDAQPQEAKYRDITEPGRRTKSKCRSLWAVWHATSGSVPRAPVIRRTELAHSQQRLVDIMEDRLHDQRRLYEAEFVAIAGIASACLSVLRQRQHIEADSSIRIMLLAANAYVFTLLVLLVR